VSGPPRHRPDWVEVDLAAVRSNAALLSDLVRPSQLMAVVKADAYGHGALQVAGAALAGGASWLAVALVEEGVALRDGGVSAPILLLSEPLPTAMEDALAHGLTLTLYTPEGVAAAARAAEALGSPAQVQVKLDTGMHRVGADPVELLSVVGSVVGSPWLGFGGLWTHFSVSDEPEDPFTALQLSRLLSARDELSGAGLPAPALLHAANSGGAICHPDSRLDVVRCGIALYGYPPTPAVAAALSSELVPAPAGGAGAGYAGEAAGERRLLPVLSWRSQVTRLRELDAGERPSYGRLVELDRPSVVATVPVGYHDGIPRRFLAGGGEVLVGGRRRRLAGAVSMDQIVVDCGPPGSSPAVSVGDEVVLIGRQGSEEITAAEWAERLGVIVYEVLCGIGPRVPRVYVG
jgi:alanine racemase